MASAYDAVFAETEEGQAVKELRRLDVREKIYIIIIFSFSYFHNKYLLTTSSSNICFFYTYIY